MVVVETKHVNGFDTSKAIYILQFIALEMKLVDSCYTFKTVYILQIVIA